MANSSLLTTTRRSSAFSRKKKKKEKEAVGDFFISQKKMLGKEKRRAERAKSFFFSFLSPLLCARDPFCHSSKKKGESGKKNFLFYTCAKMGVGDISSSWKLSFVRACTWGGGTEWGGYFSKLFFFPACAASGGERKILYFAAKPIVTYELFSPPPSHHSNLPKLRRRRLSRNFWAPQKDFIFSEICGLYSTVQNVVRLHILFWSVIRVNVYCALQMAGQFSWGKAWMPQRKSWHFFPTGPSSPHISGHFY